MALYRSRWQVELLFKRFKQNFSVTTIKAGSTNYAEAVTLLWLIIWTITERQAFMSDCFLIGKQENTYSTYEKCKISFLQVTKILYLSCSVFIDLRDEKYNRYLPKKKLMADKSGGRVSFSSFTRTACLSSSLWEYSPHPSTKPNVQLSRIRLFAKLIVPQPS